MDYNKTLYKNFARARTLSPDRTALWMDKVGAYLPPEPKPVILDLGSGTGRFAALLAVYFDARVIGVEPSNRMRAEAGRHARNSRVTYVHGDATDIPCLDESVDAAFLSMVLHHVENVPDMCAELLRVLKPGGVVIIRSFFRERVGLARHYDFFPSASAVDEARLPSIEQTVCVFDECGLEPVAHEVVEDREADSLRAYCERLKLRACSTLDLIPEAEVEEGIATMEAAAREERNAQPITSPIDFLVFRKGVQDNGRLV